MGVVFLDDNKYHWTIVLFAKLTYLLHGAESFLIS